MHGMDSEGRYGGSKNLLKRTSGSIGGGRVGFWLFVTREGGGSVVGCGISRAEVKMVVRAEKMSWHFKEVRVRKLARNVNE
jgi:hypothetical protein